MSDEKPKPFAELVPDPRTTGDEWEALSVAGHLVAAHRPAYGGALPDVCAEINAAVEAREAKLRGPFADLLKAAEAFSKSMETWHAGAGPEPYSAEHDELIRVLAHVRSENVGDYVPRAELDAANEKVKQLQAAADAIDTVEGDAYFSVDDKRAAVAAVCAHLEANGLKKPKAPPPVRIVGKAGGKSMEIARAAVEGVRQLRAATRPVSRQALDRYDGEQAAFAMVLAVLSGKGICKICGDPDDHGGRPHSDFVTARGQLLGVDAIDSIIDEFADQLGAPVELLRPRRRR